MNSTFVSNPRIVIVGATSTIATHCVRLWVARGPLDLVLVGRDPGKLARLAADARARQSQAAVSIVSLDMLDVAAIAREVDAICAARVPDVVLIAHGMLPEQRACQDDIALARHAWRVNGESPACFAEAFARHFSAAGRGTLAILGSVAGDRGRASNYVYGAAKAFLAAQAEGLRHRFAGTAVRVVLLKPGPTDTPMTAHLRAQGARLASPARVAAGVVRAIDRGRGVAYLPGQWRFIMTVIRALPAFVFDRLRI